MFTSDGAAMVKGHNIHLQEYLAEGLARDKLSGSAALVA